MEYAHPCLSFFMEFSVCGGFYLLGQIVNSLRRVARQWRLPLSKDLNLPFILSCASQVLLYDLSDNLFKAEVASPGS